MTASVFTTQSATASPGEDPRPDPRGHAGSRPTSSWGRAGSGRCSTWTTCRASPGTSRRGWPGRSTPSPVTVSLLRTSSPVRWARSPLASTSRRTTSTAEKFIPPVGTRTGTPVVQGVNEVFFNLYLPSGPRARGWVAGGDLRPRRRGQQARRTAGARSLALAASLAEQGIATIAINVVGHGFGPLSTLTVTPDRRRPGNLPRRRARHRPERRRNHRE